MLDAAAMMPPNGKIDAENACVLMSRQEKILNTSECDYPNSENLKISLRHARVQGNPFEGS